MHSTVVLTGALALILTAAWGLCAPTERAYYLTLSAHERDRFYLPCLGNDDIFVWNIQEITYPTNHLPKWVQLSNNGLVAHNISKEAKGFYSCYAYSNVTYAVEKISTIYFDVQDIQSNSSKEESQTSNGMQEIDNDKQLNLIVSDGDTLYIPCKPIVGTNSVVVWEIDGLTYPDTQLPPTHEQHYGGIIVYNASAEFLGSKYRCYTHTDSVPKELFTVHLKPNTIDPDIPQLDRLGYSQNKMYMVVRDLFFRPDYKRFSFTLNTSCQNCLCARGNQIYHVQAMRPGSFTPAWAQVTNRTVNIPSSVYQDEDVVTDVYSIGANGFFCSNLTYVFRLESNEVTKEQCALVGRKSCIELNEYLEEGKKMLVSWPLGPHSDMDCTCPIFVVSPVNPKAPSFKSCYCYNTTAYQVKLNGTELCWENLTQTTNDTNVLLVDEVPLRSSIKSWSIITQRRIIVQGPDPFPPNVTPIANTSSFCVDAKSAADWNPVVKMEVIGSDITFDVVLNITQPASSFCLNINDFLELCLPLNYTVTAYTLCTHSPSTNYTGHSHTNRIGNVCDCLHMKANLTTNITDITETSISVEVDINCLNLWPYDINLSNLFIQANSTSANHTQTVQLNVKCAENSMEVPIPDLKPGTKYTVSIVWISPLTLKPECTLTTREAVSTDMNNDLAIFIGTGVGGGFLLFVIVLVIVIVLVVLKVKKIKGNRGDLNLLDK